MSGPINPPTYAKGSRFIGRKSSTDDYETPAWATEALYNYLTGTLALDLGTNIVDPCCGRGAIAGELMRLCGCPLNAEARNGRKYRHIEGTDIRRVEKIKPDPPYCSGNLPLEPVDMFDVKWWHDSAVMNPPFTLADDMVNHLIDCNVQLICAFQRTQYMEGAKRYDAVFKDNPPAHILLFTERVSMEIEGQARLVSSGMMAFSWYIWVAGYSGPTQLHWLTAKPHFENDRRLVGTGIEVRDLLSWDKDKMFYRFECEGCGHIHIDERVKGQKGDWEPVCSRCCTPLPSRLSNNRSKFDTKWRIV